MLFQFPTDAPIEFESDRGKIIVIAGDFQMEYHIRVSLDEPSESIRQRVKAQLKKLRGTDVRRVLFTSNVKPRQLKSADWLVRQLYHARSNTELLHFNIALESKQVYNQVIASKQLIDISLS